MTVLTAVPAPPWLVALLVVVGLGVGLVLSRPLAAVGYRLDDETGPAPRPTWAVVVAVGALWGLLAWQVGGVGHGAVLPAYLLLATVGVALFWIDRDVHRLPEGLTLPTVPGLVVLLALASLDSGDWGALLRAALCGLGVWLVFVVLVLLSPSGLGLGDATLAGVAALPLGYLDWTLPVVAFLLTYLTGGLVSVVLLAVRRVGLKTAIAFGPFILVGSLGSLFVGFHHLGG